MKTKTLLMALAAFSFMLTACGNKQDNQKQNGDNTNTTVVDEQNGAEAPALELGEIESIRRVWESKPMTGIAVNGKADIERFAYVFCKEYSNYEPNKALLDYLTDPANYNNDLFRIDDQKSHGYIKSMGMVQVSWDMVCCYWNRDNGHKLVAFWMEQGHESDPNLGDNLLAFYDYDPATDVMTPEPELSKRVVEVMAQYDDYSVTLPDEGKDIELVGYKIDYENDSAESTYYLFRWNGNDFALEKAKEE